MGRKRRALSAPTSDDAVYEGQGDPLLWALFQEDEKSARSLIDSDLCSIEATDQLGWRPLHRASYAGLDGIVSLLLERRADPLAVDCEGVMPLHVAASNGHVECCKLLVAARADPTQPDRQTGMTPQIYAMSKEDEVARQLGEILGTVDFKLLAAWSNPMEMAKMVATASTDEERAVLEEKFEQQFIAKLDEPAGCVACVPKPARTYQWIGKGDGLQDHGTFWNAAMQRLPELEEKLWVQEWDEQVLEYCRDVTVACLDDGKTQGGFKLTFRFAENPYFTNAVLVKEYCTSRSRSGTDEGGAMEIKSTDIDWKPGKDVTVTQTQGEGCTGLEKGEEGNQGKQARFSFFRNFFCNLKQGGPLPAEFDVDRVSKMTGVDNHDEMVAMLMGVDCEVGRAVRDQLVPFAQQWQAGDDVDAVGDDADVAGQEADAACKAPASGDTPQEKVE